MSDLDGLAEWLLAQISDDEDAADWASVSDYNAEWTLLGRDTVQFTDDVAAQMSEKAAPHVARWHPARVLAECAAKRAIIEHADDATALDYQVDSEFRVGSRDKTAEPYCGDKILRALAAPYADRRGFREEWRV